jgi:hypothetical protein
MWNLRNSPILLLLWACRCHAVELRALPEFFRPDPLGGIVTSDRSGAIPLDAVKMAAARGSYAAFHLVVKTEAPQACRLSLRFPLSADLYREWFHFNAPDGKYYPDALIPVNTPYQFQIPDAENHIPGQNSQGFWVDLWIPPSAKPQVYRGTAELSSGSERKMLPIELSVLPVVVPAEDAVTLDNNSYGTSWLSAQYPQTLRSGGEDALIRLIHAYHRIFYDHRGTFHQLGYGHAGKVDPEFAPELTGVGKGKHVANWQLFDCHYGPLLDGSAFRDSRRGPKPIPSMYLPVNPEWPATFLSWGEPGYEAEFVNVLSEMERHFREKNWTATNFEVFFNHKKRYKGFPWDGDEVRFSRDNRYFTEYSRMLSKAIPENSPVHFQMRLDTSWTMAEQFEQLKGIISVWVANEGILTWHSGVVPKLKQHGDTIWTYGDTPPVQEAASRITLNPLRSWILGVDGFVRWETVAPGPDPWFHLEGGGETLVYPGERFGVAGPLASIRLKLQRDCLQDLALLQRAAQRGSRERIQQEVVRRYNGTALSDWNAYHPSLPNKPVLDWDNADIVDAMKPFEERFANLPPSAWLRIHELALEEAQRLL